MKITIVAGLFALVAAFLIGGRYAAHTVGVYDRFTGQVYPGGTSYRPPVNDWVPAAP